MSMCPPRGQEPVLGSGQAGEPPSFVSAICGSRPIRRGGLETKMARRQVGAVGPGAGATARLPDIGSTGWLNGLSAPQATRQITIRTASWLSGPDYAIAWHVPLARTFG